MTSGRTGKNMKLKKVCPILDTFRYVAPSCRGAITLAKTLTKEQMQLALSVMQDQFQVFEATVTEIGLAKVNPHEDVERFIL
jgi:hypothetical protein